MDHAGSYTYNYHPRQRSPSAVSSRSGGAYQNSSAFSASANPDEDWTKISDLAERRRIQNRIAQRNYRKKLKRRLEDLERRTTSSSASPEQSHRELSKPSGSELNVPGSQQMQRRASASAPRAGLAVHEQQYSPEFLPSDEAWISQASQTKPSFAFSAPPTFSFSDSYPPAAEYFPEEYPSTAYSRMPVVYANQAYPSDYMQSVSPPLPSMAPADQYKTEPQYASSDMLTPFNMNYASLAGYNVPNAQGSPDFAARTPPLTASSLYFDSRDCSPPQFALPMTPESRSASPNIALFDHAGS